MKLALRNTRDILPVEENLSRIFDDFFTPVIFKREFAFIPAIEITEDKSNIFLKAELPGMSKDDIVINLMEDSVNISGEIKTKEESDDCKMCRTELKYGKFSRTISLLNQIKKDKAKAEYKDGILYLTLPKKEQGDDNGIVKLKIE